MTILYLPKAQSDLLSIRAWGDGRWGLARTDEFLRGLVAAIDHLRDTPHIGRTRDALVPGARSISHRGYLIVYRIEAEDILVGAILHERRNFAAIDFADRLEGE